MQEPEPRAHNPIRSFQTTAAGLEKKRCTHQKQKKNKNNRVREVRGRDRAAGGGGAVDVARGSTGAVRREHQERNGRAYHRHSRKRSLPSSLLFFSFKLSTFFLLLLVASSNPTPPLLSLRHSHIQNSHLISPDSLSNHAPTTHRISSWCTYLSQEHQIGFNKNASGHGVHLLSLSSFLPHTHKIIRTPRKLWALGPPPRVPAGSQENTPRKRQTQNEAEED